MRLLLRLIVVLLIGIIAVPAAIVSADIIPPLPHAFYGNVTISDAPAEVGTVIEARGEGVAIGLLGNPITVTETGKYGEEAWGKTIRLTVQGEWKGIGDYLKNGTEITFYVDGVKAECFVGEWVESYSYIPGEVTELDLRNPGVQLYNGWNAVAYSGEPQPAIDAFASVVDYVSIVYYWNAETQLWELVITDTTMKDAVYFVRVTQDCIWVY